MVTRLSDHLAIEVGDIPIEEGAQQQAGRFPCVFLINLNMLSQPNSACTSPIPMLLVDSLPLAVVVIGRGPILNHAKIVFLQYLLPLALSLHVRLSLCLHIIIILEELSALYQHRIVALQGISRDPSLNGGATPTIDDNALRHLGLFLHTLAKEVSDS